MANWFLEALGVAAVADDALFLESPGRLRWTYGDMRRLSGQVARALVGIGVKPGDRVASQAEKSPEALLLYLGALRAGAVYLPLNTAYTPAELDYFIGDAEPALFVCPPLSRDALTPVAGAHGARLETLGEDGAGSFADLVAAAGEAPFNDVPRGADGLAAILYTSGTTGRSKGAMLTNDNLSSNALALKETWRFTEADRLIHALPIFHTHGLFVATNTVLAAGASMIFLQKFDPAAIMGLFDRASVLMGVPTFYVRLSARDDLDRAAVRNMRLFVSGSAPLLAETHCAFADKTGQAILERYGMTETGMITSNPYDGARVAGSVGFALPQVEVRVVASSTRAPLPSGEIGSIEVRGPNVFKGYWRMPDKTAAEIGPDGFFKTGDLGRLDEENRLFIVGRDKDLVISGGFNVYPKEVETEIDLLDGVIESAVIGVPHPDLGEGVTAVVVVSPGATVEEAAVLSALKDRLARYKQPKRVVVVAELPRNAMGKVQKAALRERYADLYG